MKKLLANPITIVGIIGCLHAGAGFAMYFAIEDWERRGQFGDMFGVVNALFAGLAFAGVIYTILLQRKELELQREELRLTRDELRRSAEAQENSEKALAAQVRASVLAARLAATDSLVQNAERRIREVQTRNPALRTHLDKARELAHLGSEIAKYKSDQLQAYDELTAMDESLSKGGQDQLDDHSVSV